MTTITYNPETHALVPREPSEEMCDAATADSCWENMNPPPSTAYRLMIAAAPQPEQVESEPAMWVMKHIRSGDLAQAKPNQKALHPYMWSDVFPRYTTPQPDRTAELEQLRQQVADLEKERDELIEVKAAENASWNAGFNVQVDQLKKLTAERDAALNEARDFESDVDTVTQHNVELQLETIALKSALKVAREALANCAADYLHADSVLTDSALARINEVLK